MTDAERKRAYVASLYSGPGWKRKVANMSDERVTAIYLDHQGEKPKPPLKPEPEPVQETLIDIPTAGDGVHNNEDRFEIY